MGCKLLNSNDSCLFIFNIALDSEDYALSANTDLVLSLKDHFHTVHVVTRFWDGRTLSENIDVTVVRGGCLLYRVIGVGQLMQTVFEIVRHKGVKQVLFHMNDKFAAIALPFLWFFRVRSVVWYSHAHSSSALRWSNHFVDQVITTARDAFPLEHDSIHPIGQLVSSNSFFYDRSSVNLSRNASVIVSVGRIAKSKFLEDLVKELELDCSIREIKLIGPIDISKEGGYLHKIQELAAKKHLTITTNGPMKRKDLKSVYTKYSMLYSGTKKAIDKSAIEGALCGMFVLSTNSELLHLTGMDEVYLEFTHNKFPSVREQVNAIERIHTGSESHRLRSFVAEKTKQNCSLEIKTKELVEVISGRHKVV